MEVRIEIDDAFVAEMERRIGHEAKPVELIREGLTILRWAVEETAAGRYILSTNGDGDDVKRLVMPSLSAVESDRKRIDPIAAGPSMAHPTFSVNDQ